MAKEDNNLENFEEVTEELTADTEKTSEAEDSAADTEAPLSQDEPADTGEGISDEDNSDEEENTPIRRQVVIKKKKKKVNMTSLITIIVCACIVIACFTYMAFKLDWIHDWFPTKAKMTMGDYSVIEVSSEYESLDEETLQENIDDMLSTYDTAEDITEGSVEEGDTVNMDYVGVYDGGENAGEPFDGGSAEDVDYEVGSETILFDADLVGLEIGSATDIPVTFPDDYSEESLQGVDAVFTVTINSISRPVRQEYTDEWCTEYSETFLPETLSTTDEFTEYFRNYYYEYYLHNAMFEYLLDLANIKSYDQESREELMSYFEEELTYYATYSGIDADTYATYMGFTDAEAYETYYAEYYLGLMMTVDRVCEDLGIEGTEEGLDQSIEENMKASGYLDYYTVDEYKELCGDVWLMMFDAMNYRYGLAMDALEDRVVFVEVETETETETEMEEE